MKGQLTFDEFMNITEEKPPEHKQERVPMVDPCYYCLCRSCINNAESRTITPDELPYDWQPCFFCDICRNFDGESPEDMERTECSGMLATVIGNSVYKCIDCKTVFEAVEKGYAEHGVVLREKVSESEST